MLNRQIVFALALFALVGIGSLGNSNGEHAPDQRNRQQNQQAHQPSNYSANIHTNAPPAAAGGMTEYLQRYTNYCNQERHPQDEKWQHFMACEKSSELVIAAFTVILALATGLLVVATIWLAVIASRQDRATKTIARAYVKMSHDPSGLIYNNGVLQLTVKLKNYGNTPTTITGASLTFKLTPFGARLAAIPEYEITPEQNVPGTFLVKDDFILTTTKTVFDSKKFAAVESGEALLFVIGYVDYMDEFGDRYRGGYGRQFDPAAQLAQNLPIFNQSGYNYDRKRKKGEGNDWGSNS